LRAADTELRGALERAGAATELVSAQAPREVRTFALTDLTWALAARRAALAGLETHQPCALLYSSVTAALLGPQRGAIRFDAPAAANRRGRHGLWQRPLERRRLAQAPLLVPYAEGSLREASIDPTDPRAIVVPVPIEPSAPPRAESPERDLAAMTYAANPSKKGLDRILAAWSAVRRDGERLIVCGTDRVPAAAGVEPRGTLSPNDFRALLRRARVFLAAPRREDYGQTQLEALADGCTLVTTPAPGPYAALPIAQQLDPRLVTDDLAPALRLALNQPAAQAADYAARAATLLQPLRRAAVDRVVAEQLLPALLERAAR